MTINNSKYDPLAKANTNITIDAASLGLENALHFLGKQNALPSSANNGDFVLVGKKEYIYNNNEWVELGNEDSQNAITIDEINEICGTVLYTENDEILA